MLIVSSWANLAIIAAYLHLRTRAVFIVLKSGRVLVFLASISRRGAFLRTHFRLRVSGLVNLQCSRNSCQKPHGIKFYTVTYCTNTGRKHRNRIPTNPAFYSAIGQRLEIKVEADMNLSIVFHSGTLTRPPYWKGRPRRSLKSNRQIKTYFIFSTYPFYVLLVMTGCL